MEHTSTSPKDFHFPPEAVSTLPHPGKLFGHWEPVNKQLAPTWALYAITHHNCQNCKMPFIHHLLFDSPNNLPNHLFFLFLLHPFPFPIVGLLHSGDVRQNSPVQKVAWRKVFSCYRLQIFIRRVGWYDYGWLYEFMMHITITNCHWQSWQSWHLHVCLVHCYPCQVHPPPPMDWSSAPSIFLKKYLQSSIVYHNDQYNVTFYKRQTQKLLFV